MRKPVIINGVPFRIGQVEWEDASGQMRAELPDFTAMRTGRTPVGKIITTIGLVAKIGKYWLIVTECGSQDTIYDFTVIPIKPGVKVSWAGKKG